MRRVPQVQQLSQQEPYIMASFADKSVQFFFENAGYSYDPKTETEAGARERGAHALAKAERDALDMGCSFQWHQDNIDSSDFSDEEPAWALWVCLMHDASGKVVQSLGGVDFGRDGEP